MLRIKRLYTFIYQTFLPIWVMTFGICLFIFIIQVLWQHVDKLIGKGLDTMVIVEFFTYASVMLIPQVLPLSILLASLMAFGNMGERLELVAIKASGVSLMKIMKPMIILVSAITIGSFLFQNNIGPKISVKFYSLLYSIRQKSPELAIPEGAFYNEIRGYSIYVKKKDLETHMLHGVIIYDTSKGFNNMSADVCDSALMKMADSKDYLTLTMYAGESFSNLRKEAKRTASQKPDDFIPYVRERFDVKEVIIPFKDEFERIDESRYDSHQVSKNLKQLELSIDSMSMKLDSLNQLDRKTVLGQSVFSHRIVKSGDDSLAIKRVQEKKLEALKATPLDPDSVFNSYALHAKNEIMSSASSDMRGMVGNHMTYFHIEMPKPQLQKTIRLHKISWHKMFSMSFACLIFFFIGAPLGAIIRKGGLGVPVIISVLLFIVYYIVGNIGYKMARDGVWSEWQGEWLSTAVLLPLGIFFTYKSTTESSLFNVELFDKYFRKIFRIKSKAEVESKVKHVEIEIPRPEALSDNAKLIADYRALSEADLWDMVRSYHTYNLDIEDRNLALSVLFERGVDVNSIMGKNDLQIKEMWFDEFNKSSYLTLVALALTVASLLGAFFDAVKFIEISSILLYLRVVACYISFYGVGQPAKKKVKYYIYHTLVLTFSLGVFPLTYLYMRYMMMRDMGNTVDISATFKKK